ncbi:hypothetical protein HU200_057379 [Digitaria exilis]|uniref:Fucosyltransferase n=1 Tax=Digitaria exilis TaxID=1010633 RepID=A0A835AFH5_9POAL|nr:hypothetical protein HU200_057379 [Digitaria exilis]
MSGGAGGLRRRSDETAPGTWPARARIWSGTKERWRRAPPGTVLIACTVALVFLALLFLGTQENASLVWQNAGAKLTAMSKDSMKPRDDASSTGGATAADELLGGLLVPGFDRSSCRSRYETSQYFKHSPFAPSSYLLRKLRAYEARHKRCGPGTPLYAKSVEHLRSGGRGEVDAAMECNYLVWLPYNGLGNRMMSLVSTFLYALLTDRVVLVYSPADFTDLFCEPFPDATWVLPPDFPIANLSKLGQNPDPSYRNLLDKEKIIVNEPYVFLNLGHERDIDKMFYCRDDQLVLAKVKWLLVYSDVYFVPSLYSMGEFHGELRRLFPAVESVSHLLARYLLHPTNSVWGLVTRYYDSYLANAKQRIGVQIRMFNFARIPVEDMYHQILACSRQEHILPEIEGDEDDLGTTKNGTTNSDAADAVSTAGGPTTAILIASLYADYYERLRSRYYEHAAKGGMTVSVFQPSHEEVQVEGRRGHNQKALAEIYLLSFSEVLLTSGTSTFGYMSSSLAGLRPVMLYPALTMEPCLHRPASMECQANAVDKEDLARHD